MDQSCRAKMRPINSSSLMCAKDQGDRQFGASTVENVATKQRLYLNTMFNKTCELIYIFLLKKKKKNASFCVFFSVSFS